jgi:hypothetical protein
MSDCVRCGQPIEAGQFYLHAEYIPTDVHDLLNQPDVPPEERGFLAKSPYKLHVSCPPTPVPTHNLAAITEDQGGYKAICECGIGDVPGRGQHAGTA